MTLYMQKSVLHKTEASSLDPPLPVGGFKDCFTWILFTEKPPIKYFVRDCSQNPMIYVVAEP